MCIRDSGSSVALTKAVTAGDLLVAGITTNDSGTDLSLIHI